MSTGIVIKVDQIRPALEAAKLNAAPEQLATWAGTATKRLFQRHLRTLGPNKRGWPSTNFWGRAAKATSFAVMGRTATVSVNQIGVAQRYYGGTIRARNVKMLTIPLGPEAHGKTASDFPEAFLLKTKKGAYLVQRGEMMSAKGNVVKRRGRGFATKRVVAALEFLFKLTPSVNQKPDPTVLPKNEIIFATVQDEIIRHLKARLKIA